MLYKLMQAFRSTGNDVLVHEPWEGNGRIERIGCMMSNAVTIYKVYFSAIILARRTSVSYHSRCSKLATINGVITQSITTMTQPNQQVKVGQEVPTGLLYSKRLGRRVFGFCCNNSR